MSLHEGYKAEHLATNFLKKNGLSLKTTNYRSKLGEIDLIMVDGAYIVFIEVKMRKSSDFGGALASITASKQQKIKKTAALYLLHNNLYDKHPVRFDVITIQGTPAKITWLKNAFM
jgi:putative endonuclease